MMASVRGVGIPSSNLDLVFSLRSLRWLFFSV